MGLWKAMLNKAIIYFFAEKRIFRSIVTHLVITSINHNSKSI